MKRHVIHHPRLVVLKQQWYRNTSCTWIYSTSATHRELYWFILLYAFISKDFLVCIAKNLKDSGFHGNIWKFENKWRRQGVKLFQF